MLLIFGFVCIVSVSISWSVYSPAGEMYCCYVLPVILPRAASRARLNQILASKTPTSQRKTSGTTSSMLMTICASCVQTGANLADAWLATPAIDRFGRLKFSFMRSALHLKKLCFLVSLLGFSKVSFWRIHQITALPAVTIRRQASMTRRRHQSFSHEAFEMFLKAR